MRAFRARAISGGWLIAVIPAVLGLITGAYRLGVPPLWRDEAATKAIASRPVSEILATMPHDDVVHGAYYLVVHVVIRLFGNSSAALRLPSVLAMAVACGFTALVARRLARPGGAGYAAWTGLTAGAVFAVLPATIRYAQEARSYAIVTMLATVATYLLLRAIDDGRRRWWARYGAVAFLAGLFNLFGLLVVAAHGLTLLAAGRRQAGSAAPAARPEAAHAVRAESRRSPARTGSREHGAGVMWRNWLVAAVTAGALLVPLAIMAYAQRNALSWMSASPRIGRDVIALTRFWAGSPALAWPVYGLAGLGVAASLAAGRRGLSPATVALPWLAVPPAILLAVSTTHPVYDQRYVEFCLPALAICAGSGITWLWRGAAAALRGTRPAWRAALAAVPSVAAGAALVIALQPADTTVRAPGYRPDNLEYEAQIIAANARPGDIVFFIPVNDRIVSMPFPGPWRRLRDIALDQSPTASDTLYGTDVSPAELLRRFTHVTRVWVVSSAEVPEPAYLASRQATPLDREEFRLAGAMRQVRRWRDGDTELTLYAAR